MHDERFISIVAHAARVDRDRADRADPAALLTLTERIPAAEARQRAGQLPAEPGGWLYTMDPPEPFGVEEFLRRLGQRADVDLGTAERHAAIVFTALARAVGEREFAEFHDITAQLRPEHGALCVASRRRAPAARSHSGRA